MGQLPMNHDDLGTHDECSSGQFVQRPEWLGALQQQHQMHRLSRQMKKSRRPVEQYEHYVALAVDPVTNKIVVRSSSTLKPVREDILSEAMQKLDGYIRGVTPFDKRSDDGYQHASSVARTHQNDCGTAKAISSNKRRRAGNDRDVSDSGLTRETLIPRPHDEPDTERGNFVAYRADQTAEWEKWFYDAFRAVQQVSCRIIAKEWIKTIHPKKQSTHPYNGKNPRTGERGDSNSTKPHYWPPSVIHREPDHIKKEERTKLLVHLLMNTPHKEMSSSGDPKSDKEITAVTLKESLDQKKLERQMDQLRKKFPIVEQIIDIRTILEQYEAGGLSCETLIQAPNYSDFNRNAKPGDESDEPAEEALETLNEAESIGLPDQDHEISIANDPASQLESTEALPHGLTENQTPGEETVLAHRGSNRKLPPKESRNTRSSIARKTPRHRLQPVEGVNSQLHPSVVYDWNNLDPSMSRDPRMLASGQHIPPSHDMPQMQSSYSHIQWDPQMDMSNQFADHCMISTASMPNVNQGAYVDGVFSSMHQNSPFTETSSNMHFAKPQKFTPDMHDPQQLPYRNGPDPYEASYMMQPSQSQEMMRRAFFGM